MFIISRDFFLLNKIRTSHSIFYCDYFWLVSFVYFLVDWLVGCWLVCCLAGRFLDGSLVYWFVRCLFSWLIYWIGGWVIYRSDYWLFSWLFGWMIDELIGLFVRAGISPIFIPMLYKKFIHYHIAQLPKGSLSQPVMYIFVFQWCQFDAFAYYINWPILFTT